MQLLQELSDATVGIGSDVILGSSYELRKSARVILENEHGLIAVQHLQNYQFYKLPGGGVDAGETLEAAALREVQEEVGCASMIVRPLGMIIEYRDRYKLLQINYCFVARVVGVITEPAFEPAEIAAGQTNIWLDPATALHTIQEALPTTYESHFNIPREVTFVTEYLRTTYVAV